ncbi:MAG: hypothetical protein IJU59_04650 [Firmicutes bacterium]|nr:hypothetical protein [Bacillota bacterium]
MAAEQLLKIETVPISFEYVEKQKPASLSKSIAKLEISHDYNKKAVDVKPERLHLKLDGFSSINSRDAASFDNLSYTATAGYDRLGNLKLNLSVSDAATSELRYSQVGRSSAAMADTIGSGKDDEFVNYFPLGDSSISISFDLSGINGLDEASFTPPDLELEVKEMSKVVITYVGGPLYFPKSADPNYVPPQENSFSSEA